MGEQNRLPISSIMNKFSDLGRYSLNCESLFHSVSELVYFSMYLYVSLRITRKLVFKKNS